MYIYIGNIYVHIYIHIVNSSRRSQMNPACVTEMMGLAWNLQLGAKPELFFGNTCRGFRFMLWFYITKCCETLLVNLVVLTISWDLPTAYQRPMDISCVKKNKIEMPSKWNLNAVVWMRWFGCVNAAVHSVDGKRLHPINWIQTHQLWWESVGWF